MCGCFVEVAWTWTSRIRNVVRISRIRNDVHCTIPGGRRIVPAPCGPERVARSPWNRFAIPPRVRIIQARVRRSAANYLLRSALFRAVFFRMRIVGNPPPTLRNHLYHIVRQTPTVSSSPFSRSSTRSC